MPNIDDLCGWGPRNATRKEHELFVCGNRDRMAAAFAKPFFLAGQQTSGAGKSVRLWKIYEKITGRKFSTKPPQPDGDCTARGLRAAMMFLMCAEIADGQPERYRDIYSTFNYATSRILIGKNQLGSGAGSLGSWVMESAARYGFISPDEIPNLPAYTKQLTRAWGNDRKIEGQSFRDYLDHGDDRLIKSWSPVTAWEQVRDALFHRFGITIASDCGYTMNPGRDGFHKPSGIWQHQMSIAGYSEEGRTPWVAIPNQWGDVHGKVLDPDTGEPWPEGFLCVTLDDFIKRHLKRPATECLVASNFDGFPGTIDWGKFG